MPPKAKKTSSPADRSKKRVVIKNDELLKKLSSPSGKDNLLDIVEAGEEDEELDIEADDLEQEDPEEEDDLEKDGKQLIQSIIRKKTSLTAELSNDPVRLYLREIGKVELLDSNSEFRLATILEGRRLVKKWPFAKGLAELLLLRKRGSLGEWFARYYLPGYIFRWMLRI